MLGLTCIRADITHKNRNIEQNNVLDKFGQESTFNDILPKQKAVLFSNCTINPKFITLSSQLFYGDSK